MFKIGHIFQLILGERDDNVKEIAFKAVSFSVASSATMMFVIDFFYLKIPTAYFSSFSVSIIAFLFYFTSRLKQYSKRLTWGFVVFSFILLVYSWYQLGGFSTNLVVFAIGFTLIFPMILESKQVFPSILMLAILILALLLIEINFPNIAVPLIQEPSVRLIDMYFTASVIGVGLVMLVLLYVNSNERKQATINDLNNSLLLSNKDLVKSNEKLNQALAEKSKLLRQNELLFAEMNHRVKNNLTTIGSLLNMQSDYSNDENAQKVLYESALRIHAVSKLHELLSSSTMHEISYCEFIGDLVDIIKKTILTDQDNIKFEIKCDSTKFHLNYLLPLALITNEVITNSLKYAFADNRRGIVNINFENFDEINFKLEIVDNGIGLPENFEYQTESSLGMLIISSLAQQIDGDIAFTSSENGGTCFSLSFKLNK